MEKVLIMLGALIVGVLLGRLTLFLVHVLAKKFKRKTKLELLVEDKIDLPKKVSNEDLLLEMMKVEIKVIETQTFVLENNYLLLKILDKLESK